MSTETKNFKRAWNFNRLCFFNTDRISDTAMKYNYVVNGKIAKFSKPFVSSIRVFIEYSRNYVINKHLQE